MPDNPLRAIWEQDGAALGGWLTVPSSVSAEIMAHAGFDWVCVDMQHGLIDYAADGPDAAGHLLGAQRAPRPGPPQ